MISIGYILPMVVIGSKGNSFRMLNRAVAVHEQFIERVGAGHLVLNSEHSERSLPFSKNLLLQLFDSQVKSRLLDIIARDLKEKGQSFYTIGSSGHEGNAVFGQVFPMSDMAFLHYRSGAFFIERAKQQGTLDGAEDILLSLMACEEDKISAGRHKVFGSVPLNIPPQTSTIASHLPKALGTAISLRRAKELKIDAKLPHDSVVLCSFGDASLNHASAQTTFNACGWLDANDCPLPIVFICEDNGTGISVKTPENWVQNSMQDRPGLHYVEADGLDIVDCYLSAQKAIEIARKQRKAVFLHMRCVRLMGHAGSDIESQYLSQSAIEKQESRDPLLNTAAYLLRYGIMEQSEIVQHYLDVHSRLETLAVNLVSKARLHSKEAVMQSLIYQETPSDPQPLPLEDDRKNILGTKYSSHNIKRTLQQNINLALSDLMLQYPNLLLFGEDVGKKGGVYRVTADLQKQFGQRRVFDTLLDETTILGSAIGFAHNGFLPMPEIQFLAYFHNAEDQLRGEAATLSFFSNGQYQNPMVIRIAGLAYQKGFGGHFHNDNSIAVLRDIPGLIIACPSNGRDAVLMLRECVRLAHQEKRIVVFLEPIALYMTKDLHQAKDETWLFDYPMLTESISHSEVGVFGEGDTVIISYANGYYLSRQAASILKDKHQFDVKVIDIRWLAPLPMAAIVEQVKNAKRILIVDEGRKTGSISEAIMTGLLEMLEVVPKIKRLTGEDTFIPLGDAWQYVLPSRDAIIEKVLEIGS